VRITSDKQPNERRRGGGVRNARKTGEVSPSPLANHISEKSMKNYEKSLKSPQHVGARRDKRLERV
jgi:hypothetical protein